MIKKEEDKIRNQKKKEIKLGKIDIETEKMIIDNIYCSLFRHILNYNSKIAKNKSYAIIISISSLPMT